MATGGFNFGGSVVSRAQAIQAQAQQGWQRTSTDPQPLHLTPTEARAVYADDEPMLEFVDRGHIAVVAPEDAERYGKAVALRQRIAQAEATAYQRAQAEAFAQGKKDAEAQLEQRSRDPAALELALERIIYVIDTQGGAALSECHEIARTTLDEWNRTEGGPP